MTQTVHRMEAKRFVQIREDGKARAFGGVHVIIPAKDAATIEGQDKKGIGHTVEYGKVKGVLQENLHVITNGCRDNTYGEACATGFGLVHRQDDILDRHPRVLHHIRTHFGVERRDLLGKGVAMFAGMLVLAEQGIDDDDWVIFLDADIQDIHRPDPIGCLMAGIHAWNGDVRMIKLASKQRHNEGIHAYLGITKHLKGMGAIEWILCGQIAIRWGDLKKLRGAIGYAVEVAMMAGLWLLYRDVSVFGEVVIPAPLVDTRNTDQTHVRMYAPIMAFLRDIDQYDELRFLTTEQMCAMHTEPPEFYVPRAPNEVGPPVLELRRDNALLPAIDEVVELLS